MVIFVTSPITVASFVMPIAKAFMARGWSVDIVSAPGEGLDRTAEELGATAHALPLHRGVAPLAMLKAFISGTKLVRRMRPDLVLAATPVAGLLGVVAGRTAKTDAKILHLAWGLRSESLKPPFKQMVGRLETLTAALADMTLANSGSLSRAITSSTWRPLSVSVLGEGSSHGVDLGKFRFIPQRRNSQPVIGFVGRIRRDKGIIELLEAIELLDQRGLSFEAKLVGSLEEVDLASRIEATPRTSHTAFASDVPAVMADLDVLCLPTWREGFPNVVLEAGASGRPVVTTTATGAVDAVVEGDTGLLVQPRDPHALADALEQLLRSPELRATMGESGRRRVEEHFDQEVVCHRLVDFAEQLCGVESPR
ncbi:glycosyltransferase family 4 protein [Nocardioides ganghwensis]|uniref:glycosyltransferase family 4 protein n=1 Tax=Nocardioides ganghwensis TaxID=252230 RepID=UPI0013ED3A1F|nr:glycosyltransferase family 4 protein [Nocardioides ganghwensis]MBD3947185.1 glycosyltransferase family 4 protein [Nocardioides ganghwensis]